MISENAIKQRFIVDTLRDAPEFAFKLQSRRAHQRLKKRTGRTFEAKGTFESAKDEN